MNNISKISIPLSNNVIISFGKFNSYFGYFGIDYNIWNTIRKKINEISVFSEKYNITKYHYRNLVMIKKTKNTKNVKSNKSSLTYHHIEQISHKIYDSFCITTNTIKEINSTEIPILSNYHKTSHQSIIKYEYCKENYETPIAILFIEETINNDDSLYKIKLQFKNNNKFVINDIKALLKIILKRTK
uniref:Uncharacterized protein n=1 Tax=Mimivirus LCMiAC02 TaxID=2506609 RepID=A0A481Z0F4_9VIRU|nr:MAG: hypothetical protein LCMiAC02_00020 [Mimivirus LCMiAC02]